MSLEDEEVEEEAAAAPETEAAVTTEEGGEPGASLGPGPKSVLEGIDWNVLGQMMGGKAMCLGRYQFACFLNNEVGWPYH